MFHEVNVGRIYDQKGTQIVMEIEVGVCLIQAVDAAHIHFFFVVPTSTVDILHESVCGGLQIYDQVGYRRCGGHDTEHRFVQLQLVPLQIETGKNAVFVEGVVRDHSIVKQIAAS